MVKQANDKKMYSTGGSDFEIDLTKSENVFTPWHPVSCGWVVFEMHPDSKHIIISDMSNGRFFVVDTIENKIVHTVEGHSTPVKLLAFTQDGKFLFTRSRTETILWDTSKWT